MQQWAAADGQVLGEDQTGKLPFEYYLVKTN
jgi:hypothetical protein